MGKNLIWKLSLACLIGFIAAGCETDPRTQTEQLGERIESASAIANRTQHDTTLQKLAYQAVDDEQAELAREAIGDITVVSVRDETAGNCAKKCHYKGDAENANAFLGMITSARLRQTLQMQFVNGNQ